jgi:hypothetical protein
MRSTRRGRETRFSRSGGIFDLAANKGVVMLEL